MSSKSAGYNSFTLADGESVQIPAHAEFMRCLEATAAFEFNIDDGGWQYMAAGISYISDDPSGFETFRVRNISGADNTLVLAHGWGELRDDRLTASGTVNVRQTETVNVLETGDRSLSSDGGSITEVGATLYSGTPGAEPGVEVVSAAANTNGVIIRTCCINKDAVGVAYLKVGTKIVFIGSSSSWFAENLTREIKVDAGVSISVVGDGGASVVMTYDILGA
ncbi:hypothetical protein QMT40_001447 [Parvibaculaceae bacterium PLY_AMNH_Bact1]|nr:hypothetical protein QMT40_001447 [Parvibaculaceae bacterium PLY_AMNH_Bact1]